VGGTAAPLVWLLGAVAVVGAGVAAVHVLRRGEARPNPIGLPVAAVGAGAAALGAWELGWWARRRARRASQYAAAAAEAKRLGRRLVVVGAPDGGVTSGYGCGDVTIDLSGSSCPNALRADVTKPLPFADDSVVVFCSCVLEYVSDAAAAVAEIERISGGHVFYCGVEPWTLTAVAFDGARRTLPAAYR
jgi:SAM-dependent methyltransferase